MKIKYTDSSAYRKLTRLDAIGRLEAGINIKYAIGLIDRHDALTERVKELEGAIEEVGQYILSIKTNAHNVDVETVSRETREAFAIIAKALNKEK